MRSLSCFHLLVLVRVVFDEMETEQPLPFSVASVVEDVLQQHGTRSSDVRFQSRKADEACMINLLLLLFLVFFFVRIECF